MVCVVEMIVFNLDPGCGLSGIAVRSYSLARRLSNFNSGAGGAPNLVELNNLGRLRCYRLIFWILWFRSDCVMSEGCLLV